MSYRLALVEYLNTYPFSEGIRLTGLDKELEVHRVIPAMCAQLFQERKVDISLCPVGALDDMPDHEICGKYCIGADGEVGSVVLLSNLPIEDITAVKLDDHSRTSNILLQILAKHHWKKEWKYYFDSDTKAESCLMIGDKVFDHKPNFLYAYDLAQIWKEMTALPFVFAVWVKHAGVENKITDALDRAFEKGIEFVKNEHSSLEKWQRDYLLNCISYPLDEAKLKALNLYTTFSREL